MGAEVLYRMWDQGVSLVTWFLLRRTSLGACRGGLSSQGSTSGARTELTRIAEACATAFRFPFVAFREPKRRTVKFWGRSPAGRRTSWSSERRTARGRRSRA